MKLLDLFCKAGGAGYGYYLAGFDVVGVDIEPQPNYPFPFHQADALEFLDQHWQEFDVIHASPPCQRYSRITKWTSKKEHPDLLQPTLEALKKTGKPYIVENVPGAPMQNYLLLCGTMFGLRVFRHRLFLCNPAITFSPMACNHHSYSSNSVRGTDRAKYKNGEFVTVTGHITNLPRVRRAMGISWMSRAEIVEAIPPAYTEWIGKQLITALLSNTACSGLFEGSGILPAVVKDNQVGLPAVSR